LKISLNWIRRYVDISVDPEVLGRDLTAFGLNVEEALEVRPEWERIQVARVLETRPHPNADRLTLCRVRAGDAEKVYDVVCGAQNVRAGLTVAFAPPGAVLPGGQKLRKVKLRGEVSEGMILSERELGLGDDAEGILELSDGLRPGDPLENHLGERDWVLDIEVTPNRPDWLSHLGVAREVAALYRTELREPDVSPLGIAEEQGPIGLEIEDPEGCPRYVGLLVNGLRIGSSPPWMQAALRSVGLRPINSVVDVTNFVLQELGHPMHAFDADRLEGDRVVVRRARAGERIVTIDGKERDLDPEILVIADAHRPVAVAGVMGGVDSEVGEGTTSIFLESAYFDPRRVRKGRQKLGLTTDASYRFERQADFGAAPAAMNRAVRLLVEIAGGEPEGGVLDVRGLEPSGRPPLSLRVARVNRILGTRLEAREIRECLERLQIPAEERDGGEVLDVRGPSFRRDLEGEIDLVEEVARVYGYDRVEREGVPRMRCYAVEDPFETFVWGMGQKMAAGGFNEIVTSSFMERQAVDRLGLPGEDPRRRTVPVLNPLTSRHEVLRTTLLPGMLEVASLNVNQGSRDLRLFELGKIFLPGDRGGLPDEQTVLALLIRGSSLPGHWSRDGTDYSYYDLKGVLEVLLQAADVDTQNDFCYSGGAFGLKQALWYPEEGDWVTRGGVVDDDVLRIFDVPGPLYYAEMQLDRLWALVDESRVFRPLLKYPAVKRDLSLVVPGGVDYRAIHRLIHESGGKYLESVTLFDSFSGEGLPSGTRAYGVRLAFRSAEETLADEVVDRQIEFLLEQLNRKLHVSLRS
jgi:phenylalanyl-tRNA synthetase beta chain